MPTVPQLIASNFAVLCGRYGDVTPLARQRQESWQALYRQAQLVVDAVDTQPAQARIDQFQQQLDAQQAELQALQDRLQHAVVLTSQLQHDFVAVAQAEASARPSPAACSRSSVAPYRHPVSPSWAGPLRAPAKRPRPCLPCSTRRPGPESNKPPPMNFFAASPAIMVVEPESLTWIDAQKVTARYGPTWAEQFARLPHLHAVVANDGSGLAKGLQLDNARRQRAGLPPVEVTLDVFHTLREGKRALRHSWLWTGRRKGQTPYGLLWLNLADLSFGEFLKLDPAELHKQLSSQKVPV